MKYEIGVEDIEGPVVGAEFELPDDATVIGAEKEPGSFTGGADLTVFYMTPAPKPKKTDDAGRTTAERLEMLRNNDFGDNTEANHD